MLKHGWRRCTLLELSKMVPTQAKEVEQSLWKSCFYAVIEEFRRRIKRAMDAGQPAEDNLQKARRPGIHCLCFACTGSADVVGVLAPCTTPGLLAGLIAGVLGL